MSFCRFSETCDVYAWEDASGPPGSFSIEAQGKFWREPNLEAFRDRLLILREEGCRFPDYVLDDIAEELATGASETFEYHAPRK